MKINTSNIDKNPVISEYERMFGKGENAKMYFAFRLITVVFWGMCIALVLSFVGCFLVAKYTDMKVELLAVLGIVGPIFSAPLTFMLGYLYGDKKSS